MVAALALAVYLLIPQLADVTGVWSSIKHADWAWALWALGASALTFVAAAIGLMGAVPQRLPLPTTTAAQLAGSFVNRIVPARMGGMATNLRYLQKRGVDLAVATASIGVQQVSGLVVHVALSAVLLVWAGRNAGDALQRASLRADRADRAHRPRRPLRPAVPAAVGPAAPARARPAAAAALG